MNQQDGNSSALDTLALAGMRRLAAAINGGDSKPDATKVALMFMVASQSPPDSPGLSGGIFSITKESIAPSIDTIQVMGGFLKEVAQALENLSNLKPPPGLGTEPH